MELNPDVFKIDAAATINRLCEFIAERFSALNRDGVLVPFSGGLDSSTVLLLCVRAVGLAETSALLMPEQQGNPEAQRYARLVTDQFKIKTIQRDITPILRRLGTYHFALSLFPGRFLQSWAVRKYLQSTTKYPLLPIIQGTAGTFERQAFARFNTKHRVRAVMAYLVAEEMNALVVGCAHKSEDLLGLFVKFGVDDSADLMPLKNLYRSQIIHLAAALGVPDAILTRTPNPDIIPGISDKYVDFLGLPCETLDLLLYGIEHGLEDDELAVRLALPGQKVTEIRELVRQTAHMRSPSQSIAWV